MAQAANEEKFQSPYYFGADGKTVVLQHHLDKCIRVSPKNDNDVDADGGFGKKARWVVGLTKDGGNIVITLKNEKTNDYLRIQKGSEVNAGGKGGKLCKFKVSRMSTAICKLESCEFAGAFIAVSKDGVMVGKGGSRCRLELLKEGAAPSFTLPYKFHKVKTVVLEHRDHKFLRVDPKDVEKVDSAGGKGEFAQWEATPSDGGDVCQFKSGKSGGYLRIRPNGNVDAAGKGGDATFFKVHQVGAKNEVRLESRKVDGKFLVLDVDNGSFKSGGNGNRKSIFTLFRQN